MPTYAIRSELNQETAYIRVYEGTSWAGSLGRRDKYKDCFLIEPRGSYDYTNHADSVTFKAKLLENREVKAGSATVYRPTGVNVNSWTNQTAKLAVDGLDGPQGMYCLRIRRRQ